MDTFAIKALATASILLASFFLAVPICGQTDFLRPEIGLNQYRLYVDSTSANAIDELHKIADDAGFYMRRTNDQNTQREYRNIIQQVASIFTTYVKERNIKQDSGTGIDSNSRKILELLFAQNKKSKRNSADINRLNPYDAVFVFLENVEFRDLDLSRSNFKNIVFSGAKFINCDLSKSVFENVNFIGASFDQVTFEKSIMSNLDFEKASLKDTSFRKIFARKINFENSDWNNVDLKGSKMRKKNIKNVTQRNMN